MEPVDVNGESVGKLGDDARTMGPTSPGTRAAPCQAAARSADGILLDQLNTQSRSQWTDVQRYLIDEYWAQLEKEYDVVLRELMWGSGTGIPNGILRGVSPVVEAVAAVKAGHAAYEALVRASVLAAVGATRLPPICGVDLQLG